MRLVVFSRDMRPYSAGHEYALPDKAADHLIAEGAAKISPNHAASGLQPCSPEPEPRTPSRPGKLYLTRKG